MTKPVVETSSGALRLVLGHQKTKLLSFNISMVSISKNVHGIVPMMLNQPLAICTLSPMMRKTRKRKSTP
jgi:hypothetical protein